jgi:hypothetical protein
VRATVTKQPKVLLKSRQSGLAPRKRLVEHEDSCVLVKVADDALDGGVPS